MVIITQRITDQVKVRDHHPHLDGEWEDLAVEAEVLPHLHQWEEVDEDGKDLDVAIGNQN